MRKVISLFAVAVIWFITEIGTISSASEQGKRFIFTSFGQIESVELTNLQTGRVIELGADELFDFETCDFVDSDTKEIRVTKKYLDGEIVEQIFDVEDAKETVGIYDDGLPGESWLELDGEYVFRE